MFLPQEDGAFGNNTEKDPVKLRPKLKKIYILYIDREYLLCLQSNASGTFLQKFIIFAELRLKFSDFEDSIMS